MDRIAFEISGIPIYWYGICFGLGFLAASLHYHRMAPRRGWPAEFAGDLILWIMLGTVVGARTAYVLANWGEVTRDGLLGVFNLRQGGMVFYGGLAGSVILVILLARRRRIALRDMGDFTIVAVPLGHAFGRVGCFLNGCCFGSPTEGACGVVVEGVRRHPTPLYEAGLNLLVYCALLAFTRRNPPRGRVLALYLLTYPVARFALEFLRGDDRIVRGGLHLAQWVSVTLAGIGLALWFTARTSAAEGQKDGRPAVR